MNAIYQYFIETKDKYKDILVKVTSNTYYNINRRMKTLLFEHEVVIAPDYLIVAAKLNRNLDNLVILCETCGGTGKQCEWFVMVMNHMKKQINVQTVTEKEY